MSYQVIYRKYRPKFFREVVGQENIVRGLMSAIKENKLGHAFLLSGSRGTGKTSIARILAKVMNCKYVEDSEPCGVCDSCVGIDNGTLQDYCEVDAATNRGIEDIKALKEILVYKPVSCKYRVFVVDEVHMLTPEATNCFLKELEEPRDFVKFIFCTTQEENLLDTFKSRCIKYKLGLLSSREIVDSLQEICNKESLVCTDIEALRMIARIGSGSLRDAQSCLQNFVASDLELTTENVEIVTGMIPVEKLVNIMNLVYNREKIKVLLALRAMLDVCEVKLFSYLITEFLCSLLESKIDILLVDGTDNYRKRVRDTAALFTNSELEMMIEMAKQLSKDIKINGSLGETYTEIFMLKICAERPQEDSELVNLAFRFSCRINGEVVSRGNKYVEIKSAGGKSLFVVEDYIDLRGKAGFYTTVNDLRDLLVLKKGYIDPAELVKVGVVREISDTN